MADKDDSAYIRPFKRDAYQDLVVAEEKEASVPIRRFRRNAYNESLITKEEEIVKTVDDYVTIATKKAKIALDRAIHYSGILILVLVVFTCVWIILSSTDKSQLDTATKLIFLIVGAVLGALFPHSSTNK